MSKIDPKDENIFENSKHVKSKHENSTCVHDNKIYHAGQTVSTCIFFFWSYKSSVNKMNSRLYGELSNNNFYYTSDKT